MIDPRATTSPEPASRSAGRRSRSRAALGLAARGAAILLLVLVGAEIAARVVLPGSLADARRERQELLARIPGAAAGAETGDPLESAYAASSAGFALHPYFGYTAVPRANGANNHGFFADDAAYPYRKAPGEFVVAIFGGSVAGQLSAVKQLFVERLTPALRARGYDRVRVISFALGGWREPQSFFALAYYLRSFDMAVVLDGFNEVAHTGEGELAFYPASYPFSAVWAPLAHHASSAERVLRTAELVQLNRSMAGRTRALERRPLRDSALAHLVWRVAAARYETRSEELRQAAQLEVLGEWRDVDTAPGGDVRVKRDDYLRLYEDLTGEASALARGQGKPLFHFVQPNQYDRGSKPLSDEELRERVPNDWFDLVTPQYASLRAISARLRERGVRSFDLTGIFADTRETVYADGCCHLNDRGLRLLGDAMLDRILASDDLEAIPPPERGAPSSPDPGRRAGTPTGPPAPRTP